MVKNKVLLGKPAGLVAAVTIIRLELTIVSILVTGITTVTRRRPIRPTMTVHAERFFVLPSERPACFGVVKVHAPDKARRNVAVVTFELAKDTFRVRI